MKKKHFENEHVCVWKIALLPEQPCEFQQHDAERVVFGLNGGTFKESSEEGIYSELNLACPRAYRLIGGDQGPVEIMVVEMKRPKDRLFPSMPID